MTLLVFSHDQQDASERYSRVPCASPAYWTAFLLDRLGDIDLATCGV